jgi:hypothetical protein
VTEPKLWTYFNDGERQGIVLAVHRDGGAYCSLPGTRHRVADGLLISLAMRGDKIIVSTGDVLVTPGDQAFVAIDSCHSDMRRGWSTVGSYLMIAGTYIEACTERDAVDGGYMAVVELGGLLFPEAPVKLTPPPEQGDTTAPLSAYSVGDIVEVTRSLMACDPPVGTRCKVIELRSPPWSVRVDWNDGDWVQPRQLKLISRAAAPSQLTIEIEKVEADLSTLRRWQENPLYRSEHARETTSRDVEEALHVRAALRRVQEAAALQSVEVTQALAFKRYVELDRKLREVGYQNDCEAGDALRDEMDPCWYAMTEETQKLATQMTGRLRRYTNEPEHVPESSSVQAPTENPQARTGHLQPLDEPAASYWRAIQTARNAIDETVEQLAEARRIRNENAAPMYAAGWFDYISLSETLANVRKELPELPATGAVLEGGCVLCGDTNTADRAV